MCNTIKKLLALLLSASILALSGCTSDGSTVTGGDAWDGVGGMWPESQGLISSIFAKDVEYDSFTPSDNIALPVETSEITNVVQLEKTLFIAAADGIYSLNLESGESGQLCEAKFAAVHADSLFTYDADSGKISVYNASGEPLQEQTLSVQTDELEVEGFYVTDDCYVFICYDMSENIYSTQYNAFSRETLENVCSFNEKASSTRQYYVYSAYKGNSILKAGESSFDARIVKIYELNFDSGEMENIVDVTLDANPSYTSYGIAYNGKKGTALALIGPKNSTDASAVRLIEFSLDSTDNVLQQKFFITPVDGTKYFVTVYENIVSAICSADNEYRYFDYVNPPQSITLACSFASFYDDVISGFEEETGILVRTVNYGADQENRLDIKLMAGDTDFDLFIPSFSEQQKYFSAGMYEDLSQYDGLKQRLDQNAAANAMASLGDTYVGMPISIGLYIDKQAYPDSGPQAYSIIMSKLLYCANNFNIIEGTYLDPDGDELYKLLKFIYDNPDGNEAEMPYSDDCMLINSEFLVMNPSGSNKENTVKFLEYVFDAMQSSYIDISTAENVYILWKTYSPTYSQAIYSAANTISQCDGKNSTIKQIAKEAAQETLMLLAG